MRRTPLVSRRWSRQRWPRLNSGMTIRHRRSFSASTGNLVSVSASATASSGTSTRQPSKPPSGDKRIIPLSISRADLEPSSSKFDKLQRVLSQRLTHATHPESADSFLKEKFIHGGEPGVYDGILFENSRHDDHERSAVSAVPPTTFMQIQPESEGVIYPFTRYPNDLPAGADVSIVTFDMAFLARDEYKMFYNHTCMMEFDPRISPVVQSQVLFVHCDDGEAMDFASRKLTPLDKRSNAILSYSEQHGWSFSTRYLNARAHNIVAVFLGGLRLTDEILRGVQVIKGTISRKVGQQFYCVVPGCDHAAVHPRDLRDHYRETHAGVPYKCDHDGCSKSFATRWGYNNHQRVHDEHFASYKCTFEDCDFECHSTSWLREHIKSHTHVYYCSEEGCTYSTKWQAALRTHMRVHQGVEFVCTEPDCGARFLDPAALIKHARHQHEGNWIECKHAGCSYASRYLSQVAKHQRLIHQGTASSMF